MKKSFALFTAALWPAAAFAQTPVKVADTAAAAAPPIAAPAAAAPTQPAPILDHVEFKDADLPAIIEYLKAKNEELGGDQRNLNIILSPGLEKLQVPGMSLRNVTIADVLTITSNVLDVQLEPVISAAGGENVAWIVKNKAPSTASGLTAPSTSFVPADSAGSGNSGGSGTAALSANATGAGGGAGFIGSTSANTATTSGSGIVGIGGGTTGGGSGFGSGGAGVVELAATGTAGGGAAPRTVTKVIGMAALVSSTRADLTEREKERREKFALLVHRLQNLADAEGRKAEIKAYGEMEIIVVKSDDAEGINLVSEAIDALKANAVADRANQNHPDTPNPVEKAGGQ